MQAYRRSLGVVFQDFKLIPTKTVFDNVAFVMRVLGVPVEQQRRRTYQVLKGVGLQHRALAFPPELSGGEQQRIAIARALVNEPQVVLADEPTGNLDPDLSLEIMDLFRDINAAGTTVLVATHDRELIAHVGRRVLHLEQGRAPGDRGMRALPYAWQEAVTSLARARWTLLLSIATIAVAFAMLGAVPRRVGHDRAGGRRLVGERPRCRSTSTTSSPTPSARRSARSSTGAASRRRSPS